ncbi:MAG TPA: phage tail protein I [Allosphingosinicella sp.]|jgi:phage tail P2-like protein
MPADRTSLLPPNATRLERNVELAAARVDDVPVPLRELWDPYACEAWLLPWLAWGLSVDRWDSDWSEARKRHAVATSIELHRTKGTPAAVEAVLASFDDLARLVEWHETTPRGAPHTFEILLPMVTPEGTAPGGPRSRAAFAEAIIRDVARVKRLSQHFELVQSIAVSTAIGLAAVSQTGVFLRIDAAAAPDPDPAWLSLLLSEDGEPLQDDAGNFLEVI